MSETPYNYRFLTENDSIVTKNKLRVTNATGAIQVGKNLKDMSCKDILKQMLITYKQPEIKNISPSGTSVYEYGTNVSISSFKFEAVKNTEPLTSIQIKHGYDTYTVIDVAIPDQDNLLEKTSNNIIYDYYQISHTFNPSITINGLIDNVIKSNQTKYILCASITDDPEKKKYVNYNKVYSFVYPFYYCNIPVSEFIATDNGLELLNPLQAYIDTSTKSVKDITSINGQSITYPIQTEMSRSVIIQPASWPNIKTAIDKNNFTQIWTQIGDTHTIKLNNKCTAENYKVWAGEAVTTTGTSAYMFGC